MKFEEVCELRNESRITIEEAARMFFILELFPKPILNYLLINLNIVVTTCYYFRINSTL